MTVFVYKAMDVGRSPVQGTVAADTPHQAREELRARGMTVQEIVEHEAMASRRWLPRRGSGRYAASMATTIRELATLLGAGIPMLDALKTIAAQQHGRLRTALVLLRDRVAAGIGLAEAMAEQD